MSVAYSPTSAIDMILNKFHLSRTKLYWFEVEFLIIKFVFTKNATKIDDIFTADLTLCCRCQIDREDFVNFVAFLENMNFTRFMKKKLVAIYDECRT